MNVLIVGGAGYIGSHINLLLLEAGFNITVFDDLSTGAIENIDSRVKFLKGTTLSKTDLKNVFSSKRFDVVIHLAASKSAGESMRNPFKFAENNIVGGLNLIQKCIENGVKKFIFSSTAAVYGLPRYNPIDEQHILDPLNYYGFSKLVLENNLQWFSKLESFNYASLRYFNAAGYDNQNRIKIFEKKPTKLNS